jgi:hypothetical protein
MPVITDQLLSGIPDMDAEGGQGIESRTGGSAWESPAGAAIVTFEIIGDLTVLGIMVQSIQRYGRWTQYLARRFRLS